MIVKNRSADKKVEDGMRHEHLWWLILAMAVGTVAPCLAQVVEDQGKFSAVYVDSLPEVITRVEPLYPDSARAWGVTGTVVIEVLVGKNGRVRAASVVKSIPMLDRAATAAIREWAFRPAMSNGRPVPYWIPVSIAFPPIAALRDTAIPKAVVDYLATLSKVLSSSGSAPIESLYAAGMRAADSLMLPIPDSDLSPLESMDDSSYASLQHQMRGFMIWREEGTAVLPDPGFFLALARSRGDAADTTFFHSLRFTRDKSGWPTYVQQQTDYSGCTDFGSGHLVSSYAVWKDFLSLHPGRYARWGRECLGDVEQELVSSTCACGDLESVRKELQAFLRKFPAAEIAGQVRSRLQQIESGKSSMRFSCVSG